MDPPSDPQETNVRSKLAALAVIAAVAGCGPSPAEIPAATVSTVAVQPGDVPSTLPRCRASGGIDSWLSTLQVQNDSMYFNYNKQWDLAKQDGATSAEVALYTDSSSHCDYSTNNGSGTIALGTYPLVLNIVIQFKDEASATNGYTSGSLFGFDQAIFKAVAGAALSQGKSTGLGANSMAYSTDVGNKPYYVVVWQQRAFVVIVVTDNLDPATGKKIAQQVNGRIH